MTWKAQAPLCRMPVMMFGVPFACKRREGHTGRCKAVVPPQRVKLQPKQWRA